MSGKIFWRNIQREVGRCHHFLRKNYECKEALVFYIFSCLFFLSYFWSELSGFAAKCHVNFLRNMIFVNLKSLPTPQTPVSKVDGLIDEDVCQGDLGYLPRISRAILPENRG